MSDLVALFVLVLAVSLFLAAGIVFLAAMVAFGVLYVLARGAALFWWHVLGGKRKALDIDTSQCDTQGDARL